MISPITSILPQCACVRSQQRCESPSNEYLNVNQPTSRSRQPMQRKLAKQPTNYEGYSCPHLDICRLLHLGLELIAGNKLWAVLPSKLNSPLLPNNSAIFLDRSTLPVRPRTQHRLVTQLVQMRLSLL